MSFGALYGAQLIKIVGYAGVFYSNALLLFFLFLLALFVYPYDPPVKELVNEINRA